MLPVSPLLMFSIRGLSFFECLLFRFLELYTSGIDVSGPLWLSYSMFVLCVLSFKKVWRNIIFQLNGVQKMCSLQPRGSLLFVSLFGLEYKKGRLALGKWAVRGDKKGTPLYAAAAAKQTQNIDYIIFTDTQSSLWLLFTWHEVNSASDCRLPLCISFAALPWYIYVRDLFPPLISPNTFRADLPTVSFITANILNHLSCVSHQFGAWSPLNRSHLNVPVLIAGAGGNTLRDWDSQWHSAERPLSIYTKFPLTFWDMSF